MLKYLLLFLVMPIMATSQTNFKQAIIVNNQGDTVKGFIDYKEVLKTPNEVTFKEALSQIDSKRYNAQTIRSFELINICRYQSFQIRISMGRLYSPGTAIEKIDTTTTNQKVFLKVLDSGKNVSLFSYEDRIKTRFYIKENDSITPDELLYSKIGVLEDESSQSGSAKIHEIFRFRNQLSAIAEKYQPSNQNLKNKIAFAKYIDTDLRQISRLLNDSKKEEKDKNNWSRFRYFAGAGLNISKPRLDDDILEGNNNGLSYSPIFSAGIDVFVNPDVGRLFFRIAAGYTEIKSDVNGLYKSPYVNFRFHQKTFSISPQVFYNFYNAQQVKVFGGAGLIVNQSTYNNLVYYNEPFTGDRVVADKWDKNWLAGSLTAGLLLKNRMELSAQYNAPSLLSSPSSFNIHVSSIYFQAKYLIGPMKRKQ